MAPLVADVVCREDRVFPDPPLNAKEVVQDIRDGIFRTDCIAGAQRYIACPWDIVVRIRRRYVRRWEGEGELRQFHILGSAIDIRSLQHRLNRRLVIETIWGIADLYEARLILEVRIEEAKATTDTELTRASGNL